MERARVYDVIVVGGGPAGATAAIRARRNGLTVGLIERDAHPRFHIGESFLPRHLTLLRELGLLERVQRIPQVAKFGASFAMADDAGTTDFWFSAGPNGEDSYAFSIERAPFDKLLWDIAGEEGVELFERTGVTAIERLDEGGVRLATTAGVMTGRVLLDASGQGTLVGRHLGTRKTLPDLCRVAYFQHFEGVERRAGDIGGHPIIVMCEEGWFWIIPIDERRTSVGLVMEHAIGRSVGVAADKMLAWGIGRSPFVKARMASAIAATGPHAERGGTQDQITNHVCADFSYTCEPYAGPGYFLVGDAATFVDPIFSTGVCLGMMSAVQAADAAAAGLRDAAQWPRLRREYAEYVRGSSAVFFNLVRRYYGHGFREMFLEGTGPLRVHKAILSVLAGHVFPRPVWSLRWRLRFFEVLLGVNERVRLVPERKGWSLVEGRQRGRHGRVRAESVA